MWVMPLMATLTAGFTAGMLLRFFRDGRDPALLAWSVALMLLGTAAACAFIGSIDAWTVLTAKIYFISATALFTACMSLGSIYFNAARIIGHIWLVVLLVVSATAVYMLWGVAADNQALAGSAEPGRRAIDNTGLMGDTVVALSSIGTLVLVTAAIYALVYRRSAGPQAMIAAGVLLVTLAGSLNRLDAWEWAFLAQLPGMLIVFAGAVAAGRVPRR